MIIQKKLQELLNDYNFTLYCGKCYVSPYKHSCFVKFPFHTLVITYLNQVEVTFQATGIFNSQSVLLHLRCSWLKQFSSSSLVYEPSLLAWLPTQLVTILTMLPRAQWQGIRISNRKAVYGTPANEHSYFSDYLRVNVVNNSLHFMFVFRMKITWKTSFDSFFS